MGRNAAPPGQDRHRSKDIVTIDFCCLRFERCGGLIVEPTTGVLASFRCCADSGAVARRIGPRGRSILGIKAQMKAESSSWSGAWVRTRRECLCCGWGTGCSAVFFSHRHARRCDCGTCHLASVPMVKTAPIQFGRRLWALVTAFGADSVRATSCSLRIPRARHGRCREAAVRSGSGGAGERVNDAR